MRKMPLWALGVALLGGLGGCGGNDPMSEKKDPLSQKVAAVRQITTLLEGIKDDASAEAAFPRLEKAVARFQEAGKKFDSLMSSSKEEANQLIEKHVVDLAEGLVKVQAAAAKAGKAAPGKKDQIMAVLNKEDTTKK
jgi:hypothetical protein